MVKVQIRHIGLFGGTFDPVHYGHLITGERVRELLSLEKLVFIPAKIHPFKADKNIQSSHHRLKMLSLALENNPFFEISEIELEKDGISYTVDTLRAFRKHYPADRFKLYFLMGMDNVPQFHQWKHPEEILQLCQVAAFGRPGAGSHKESGGLLSAIQFVEAPQIEISATEIRERVSEGRSIRYLVPPEVEKYIQTHSLYL